MLSLLLLSAAVLSPAARAWDSVVHEVGHLACAALSTGEQVCALGEEETGCGCAAGGGSAAAGAASGLLGLLVGWRRRRA